MADIITLANSIFELTSGIRNAELQKKLSELTLAAAQSEMDKARLMKENSELKEQLGTLLEDREHPLVFRKKDNLYYEPGDRRHSSPYCQHCYEDGHRRFHLTKKYVCPHCGRDFRLLSVHGFPDL
jgi:hypothetical protein